MIYKDGEESPDEEYDAEGDMNTLIFGNEYMDVID